MNNYLKNKLISSKFYDKISKNNIILNSKFRYLLLFVIIFDIIIFISNIFQPFRMFFYNLMSLDAIILISINASRKYIEAFNKFYIIYKFKDVPPEGLKFRKKIEKWRNLLVYTPIFIILGVLIGSIYCYCIINLNLITINFTGILGLLLMLCATLVAFFGYFVFLFNIILFYQISEAEYNIESFDKVCPTKTEWVISLFKMSNEIFIEFKILGLLFTAQFFLLNLNRINFHNPCFLIGWVIIFVFIFFVFICTSFVNIHFKNKIVSKLNNSAIEHIRRIQNLDADSKEFNVDKIPEIYDIIKKLEEYGAKKNILNSIYSNTLIILTFLIHFCTLIDHLNILKPFFAKFI